ncbi:hypothetical protein CONCODRAFT_69219 [Conidiobolus coronatus NRRL 28638]|uniref:Uncharacterized protein n=1 Tax=Conidiobolus coronatus (strain ATCC 28846 / CBS 209.66 / NRRL 28638) TaxID=796925 RepID=A0A137PB74_CONC2|nr:hypothetical protein CONCODRAFT_69219 [Conidiobolus coronatus NRRL 28638]|eukprot:KXN72259.1 hypothetical protein CONCODRAFT_69219 [Conidiobolus coronatus NRRL 28638]
MSALQYTKNYSNYKKNRREDSVNKITGGLSSIKLDEGEYKKLTTTQLSTNIEYSITCKVDQVSYYKKIEESYTFNYTKHSKGIEVYEDIESDYEEDEDFNYLSHKYNETEDEHGQATSSSYDPTNESKLDYYFEDINLESDEENSNFGDSYNWGGDYYYFNNGDDYGNDEGGNIDYYGGISIDYDDDDY